MRKELIAMRLEDEIKQEKFKSLHQKAFINIVFTSGWLGSKQAGFFKSFGISPQQFNILRILRGQYPKPASVSLLMDRMLDKMSNASRLVEKLKVKGLVERQVCESDRRQVDVIITEKGLTLLSEIDVLMPEQEKNLANLNDQELTTLNELLDKLRG